ncbi:hypothetical protein PV326_001815 [Microctonus aethiopoides]|uniref:Uncharacterized protein n=1 Tax=Microctonus aethiopoides TaxID=144406 RepID=A0AA39FWC1_9HYME|nr:hypothetical protein PV326_001815 [Microctonus aethiopoides]KAK0177067.1 hypothetical protein PV328_001146 [Microctonus aethiopoides]
MSKLNVYFDWTTATPANAISGFRGSGIYPVNQNALSDAEFAISDIALGEHTQERESENLNDQVPDVSGKLALPERIQESDRGLVLNQQNEVPPLGEQDPSDSPSSNLSTLSQDCLALRDSEIENYICDGTELSLPSLIYLNESQNQNRQKESPSKFLLQSSPIPKIPLSMSKRAEQSAEILNSNDKIIQKKNEEEKTKKTNKMINKKSIVNKREQPRKMQKTKKYIDIISSERESNNIDFVELIKKRASRKRKVHIYSSDSENEENAVSSKKATVDNYCVECFESYNFTKSKSDWIRCSRICQMWLHETCSNT